MKRYYCDCCGAEAPNDDVEDGHDVVMPCLDASPYENVLINVAVRQSTPRPDANDPSVVDPRCEADDLVVCANCLVDAVKKLDTRKDVDVLDVQSELAMRVRSFLKDCAAGKYSVTARDRAAKLLVDAISEEDE